MVDIIRFLMRDYPAVLDFKAPSVQNFQLERHPFESLSVYKNGTAVTGVTSNPQTGTVSLPTAPEKDDLITVRYSPVWFTDEEIERAKVIDYTSEYLWERSAGSYTFASLKMPLVYKITIDEVEQTAVYDETLNTFALDTGEKPLYEGTVCNVYATAAYLYTVMASDPDRIRANYGGRITDIPSVQNSFREQAKALFKLGGVPVG